jgi:hypothetical protein
MIRTVKALPPSQLDMKLEGFLGFQELPPGRKS